ncbi:MAG: sporulation protein YabP [Syntrophomonadaceae bacterium]|nr:sporulation protein YabP [Syntrophomonadaceae bacterium]
MAEHSVSMQNRRNVQMAGIKNVITFDEDEIILESELGFLAILGEDLHVTMLNLEQGKVSLAGNVRSMEYKEQSSDIKARGKSILNRLLK